MQPAYRLLLCLTPLLVVGWLSIALIDPEPDIAVGYFLGALYAHVTLSAALAALGPGRLVWRVPAAVGWMVINIMVIVVNTRHSRIPEDAVFLLGMCLVIQWLVLQLPLWGLALGVGMQVRYGAGQDTEANAGHVQFGIRHLLIIMGIVGAVLGIGRVAIPLFVFRNHEGPLLLFLSLASIVMALPLLLSALMRRMAILGVPLSLLLVGVATAIEIPLMRRLEFFRPDVYLVVAINVASAAVVLIVGLVVRLNGYCLYAGRKTST